MFRVFVTAVIWLGAVVLAVVLLHLAVIEVGREVVTLRTQHPDGSWEETRLWVVDHDGATWVHSAGPAWAGRFDDQPVVELERGGATRRYTATPVPGPHPAIDAALQEKYGLADRWVRLIAPCDDSTIPVRLEPLNPDLSSG